MFQRPLRILREGQRTGDFSGEKRKRKRQTSFVTEEGLPWLGLGKEWKWKHLFTELVGNWACLLSPSSALLLVWLFLPETVSETVCMSHA